MKHRNQKRKNKKIIKMPRAPRKIKTVNEMPESHKPEAMTLQQRIECPKSELLLGADALFIDNGGEILAVAHTDSVRASSYHYIERNGIVWSTALDDRLGVFAILDLLPVLGVEGYDILLTDDEERGDSTAELFVDPPRQYNWMFSFDRAGTDAVIYSYEEMEPYVRTFFELGRGSFSDISSLDHLGCGGVNVGTGYYHEHRPESFAILRHLEQQAESFVDFWEAFSDVFIEHEGFDWKEDESGEFSSFWSERFANEDEEICLLCEKEMTAFDAKGLGVCKPCLGEYEDYHE